MPKTAIQHIKAAANKLRDSKLSRLGCVEIKKSLEGVRDSLGLASVEEAIVMTALFERTCAGRYTDCDDLARYFGAAQLDVMEYVPALRTLYDNGYLNVSDVSELRIVRQNFMVSNYVVNCVLDNKKPTAARSQKQEKEFDRYDFCKGITSQIHSDEVTTDIMLQYVALSENEHPKLNFVAPLQALVPSLQARALFYEMCYDFFNAEDGGRSSLDQTLEDMFPAYGVRFRERNSLLDGSHPLLQAGLIEVISQNRYLALTPKGKRLFLGDDYGIFEGKKSALNIYSFVRNITQLVRSNDYDSDDENALTRLDEKLRDAERENAHLHTLDKVARMVPDAGSRALLYLGAHGCATGSSLSLASALSAIFPVQERNANLKSFKDDKHPLQVLDLVEMSVESSLFGEHNVLNLTDNGKTLVFGDDARYFIDTVDPKNLIAHDSIKAKHLFFAPDEQAQLTAVGNALTEEMYSQIRARLDDKGLSKGIAVLLYGAPGTGKTESVMQWARATGRDIVHVDISASKSMWYGESEKIIKEIFNRYRKQCRCSERKPILLFNEADAIFSKRRDIAGGRSTDQTENTIQNIILEEMERLDGILIATTNLADNLDKAFERRFLYKIRLNKPTAEAKRHIWLDKLPWLSDEQAMLLAKEHDFSGGEIDNIVRKALMAEVIDGKCPDYDAICRLCIDEKIGSPRPTVGF